jgi:hypothetical protein
MPGWPRPLTLRFQQKSTLPHATRPNNFAKPYAKRRARLRLPFLFFRPGRQRGVACLHHLRMHPIRMYRCTRSWFSAWLKINPASAVADGDAVAGNARGLRDDLLDDLRANSTSISSTTGKAVFGNRRSAEALLQDGAVACGPGVTVTVSATMSAPPENFRALLPSNNLAGLRSRNYIR